MKNRLLILVLSLVAIAGLVIVGCAPEAATPEGEEEAEVPQEEKEQAAPAAPGTETYQMDFQAWPGGGPYLEQIKMFSDRVEGMSSGRIDVTLHAGGELCPMTKEFEALESGAIDWAGTCFNFNLGRFGKVAGLFGAMPCGPNPTELYAWLEIGGERELINACMQQSDTDVMVVGGMLHLAGAESFGWFKEPITSLSDFDGMKYRCMGLYGDVAQKLGASVVNLPGGEIYQAFERGVIDGFEYCTPSMDYAAGFQDLDAVMHEPGMQSTNAMCRLMVREDTWNEVPDDLKPIIEAASSMSMIDHSWIHMEDAKAMVLFEEAGIEVAYLPEEVQTAIYELIQVVHEENSAADPFYKEVYEAQQEFLNAYRIVEYKVQPEYRWMYE